MKKPIIYSIIIIFVIILISYFGKQREWKLYTRLIDHKGWTFEVWKKNDSLKVIQYTDQIVGGHRIESPVNKWIRLAESCSFIYWQNEYGKFEMTFTHNINKLDAKGYILFNDSIINYLQPIVYPSDSKYIPIEKESQFLDSTGFVRLPKND